MTLERLVRIEPDAETAAVSHDFSGVINRAAPIPYYVQLAEILRQRIAAGAWKPGEMLPPESELCALFALSRTAVRQALDELAAEGLVQKRRGRGTFVSTPKPAEFVVQEARGFVEEMSAKGHEVRTVVVAQEVVEPPPHVAAELALAPRAKVVHISRIRLVNGEPILKTDSYLPAARFARLRTADLTARSLYETLADEFGVEPRGGRRRIEATVASRELADALGLDVGAPILMLTAVSVAQDGIPFEWFRAFYRGDRTVFEVRVEPPERARRK